jgi:HK97 family phage portal protein
VKLIDRLFGRKAAELTYDQIANLIDGAGGRTVAGISVTAKSALQVPTVLACVRAIADGCSTPDLHVYREKGDGTSELATNIPEYRLLSRRPNEWQTSFEWRRLMTIHAALTGSALSIKVRGDNRRVRELIPVQPGRWDVRQVSRYELRYRCFDDFGLIGEFQPDDVFVLNGVQWDWVKSLNAVSLAASAIGLAMATERSQSAMHANGLRPSGTYSVTGTLNKEQHAQLTAWLKAKGGLSNAGDPLVLDRDAKWLSTGQTGVDAQHVETRKLQIEEVCRAYGVFPSIIGHSDKASTYASAESFFDAHLRQTLAPWHKAWRDALDERLLDGSGPLFTRFDTRYMVAGSMKDRAQWARTMAEMGIYTRNEIRDEEGKDPLPGLDEPLTPMNMSQPAQANQAKQYSDIERKLESLAQRQAPVHIDLKTSDIERSVKGAIDTMSQAHADHIKAIASEMPITINMPEQPAPVVNVHPSITVDAPAVHFEATVPAAQVVMSGPKSSTQKVDRDADGEILQTTTTHNY